MKTLQAQMILIVDEAIELLQVLEHSGQNGIKAMIYLKMRAKLMKGAPLDNEEWEHFAEALKKTNVVR